MFVSSDFWGLVFFLSVNDHIWFICQDASCKYKMFLFYIIPALNYCALDDMHIDVLNDVLDLYQQMARCCWLYAAFMGFLIGRQVFQDVLGRFELYSELVDVVANPFIWQKISVILVLGRQAWGQTHLNYLSLSHTIKSIMGTFEAKHLLFDTSFFYGFSHWHFGIIVNMQNFCAS